MPSGFAERSPRLLLLGRPVNRRRLGNQVHRAIHLHRGNLARPANRQHLGSRRRPAILALPSDLGSLALLAER